MVPDEDDLSMQGEEAEAEEWDDWQEEEEPAQSLFSAVVLPSAAAAFDYDAQHSHFDLRAFRKQARLDDYSTIRCVNFIRSEVAAGRDPLPALAEAAAASSQAGLPWDSDRYLQPVLPEDALLFHDFDDDEAAPDQGQPATMEAAGRPLEAASVDADMVQALRDENEALRCALRDLALSESDPEVARIVTEAASGEGPSSSSAQPEDPAGCPNGSPAQPLAVENKGKAALGTRSADAARIDQNYFDSYSGFNIHREMLSDRVRTKAYRDALERNPGLLQGSRVLDVGCGTGILSMFAARAGATTVIGVDGSTAIADVARRVCEANQVSATQGGAVSIVTGRIEQLGELPVQQVDVIVSEWMGYGLLFECMLDSVLYARDRWLKPGGAVLPDKASICIAGAEEAATGLDFWRNVYGFSMAPIASDLRAAALQKGVIVPVAGQHIITNSVSVADFDLAIMTAADTDFTQEFLLTYQREEGRKGCACHAIVLWFDTEFSSRYCAEHPVVLSTSPHQPMTHWTQTVLCLREPIMFGTPPDTAAGSQPSQGPIMQVKGRISIARQRQRHRSVDISLEVVALAADGSELGQPDTTLHSIAMSD